MEPQGCIQGIRAGRWDGIPAAQGCAVGAGRLYATVRPQPGIRPSGPWATAENSSDLWPASKEPTRFDRRLYDACLRRRLRPRGPLPHRVGADLPDREPGARPPAADAARTRPRGGPEHGGLHLGLPRLAARDLRHESVGGEGVPRLPPDPLRAGPERRPGRDGGVRDAAGDAPRRGPRRGRLLDVVRQGAGRRPLLRCAEARELRRDRRSTAACSR